MLTVAVSAAVYGVGGSNLSKAKHWPPHNQCVTESDCCVSHQLTAERSSVADAGKRSPHM